MNPRAPLYLAFAAILLAGCAALGLQLANTNAERLTYGYAALASVRAETAKALDAQTLKLQDAEHVLALTDTARRLLDAGRALLEIDPKGAGGKIDLATGVLAQVKKYLPPKGAP